MKAGISFCDTFRHGLEINECSEHGKPLEIICIVDKQLLCPHCAIFG